MIDGSEVDSRMAFKSYSLTDKARVLGTYLEEGSYARASRATGVDEATIRAWMGAPELRSVVVEMRSEFASGVAVEAASIASLAMRKLRAKLEEGTTGARDLSIVFGVLTDKVKVWRDAAGAQDGLRPCDIVEASEQNYERMEALAREILRRAEERKRAAEAAGRAKDDGGLH
jgi:hypothetical protein